MLIQIRFLCDESIPLAITNLKCKMCHFIHAFLNLKFLSFQFVSDLELLVKERPTCDISIILPVISSYQITGYSVFLLAKPGNPTLI